jgi:integrase
MACASSSQRIRGMIHVFWQTYPGRGGLVTKGTKGRRRRTVPIIDPLRPTLVRLTAGRRREERLVLGPRGGVITTATLRDATGWDALVTELGQPGLVRHGLRHTALTWMADAGVDLHILQRVADQQDPAVTARYLHADVKPCWTLVQRFGQVVCLQAMPGHAGNYRVGRHFAT